MEEFAIKRKSKVNQDEQFARVKEICQPFYLTNDELLNIKQTLFSEIQKGLKKATNPKSSIKCWPTNVQEYPCGCEHGMFLILKIGESKFHISFIHLKGSNNYHYEKETQEIPKELYSKNINNFFDHLVESLNKFLRGHNLNKEYFDMALCIKSLVLQNLSQQLNIPTLKDKEVLELLQSSINRRKDLRLTIETVLCNSTAILLANSWQGRHCKLGVNIGNGCNAVYMEQVTEIEFLSEETTFPHMIVNTEWGEFGLNGELEAIRTIYDKQVDNVSSNKNRQIFEKLTSGLYLAELARQIFLHCIKEKILFEGHISEALKVPFSFTCHHVSEMLSEEEGIFDRMCLMFDKLGITKPNKCECSKVYYILYTITQRSASLVASGIASVMEKLADKHIAIGLGGSFYFNCRIYHDILEEKLKELINNEYTFEIKFLENDVAIGSAILTAINKSKEFLYQSEEMRKLLHEAVGRPE